jgi:Flp pilus assembly protein CpaB
MSKKTIIQLVVIIVAFGAAGVVLYNGFFNNAALQTGIAGGTAQATSTKSILPYGDTLDFSKALNSNRFQYNQIDYPQLKLQNDVGISQNSLITPTPVNQPAQ